MQAAVAAQAAANLGQAQANNLAAVSSSAQIAQSNAQANQKLLLDFGEKLFSD